MKTKNKAGIPPWWTRNNRSHNNSYKEVKMKNVIMAMIFEARIVLQNKLKY
jgi:hypothetical protein